MFFVLATNCRPVDAAYLVAANSFATTSAYLSCDYVALVPARNYISVAWYKWPLERKLNWAVELVGELHAGSNSLGPLEDSCYFAKGLHRWFNASILKVCAK